MDALLKDTTQEIKNYIFYKISHTYELDAYIRMRGAKCVIEWMKRSSGNLSDFAI